MKGLRILQAKVHKNFDLDPESSHRKKMALREPKIFCIGFQKTGTTSLGLALGKLGYRVCGPVGVTNPGIRYKALDWALEKTPYYDAFEDNPWPLLYKELDQRFPGSKFILTYRHPRAWIKSAKKYFGYYEAAAEVWIYDGVGSPIGNQRRFLKRYKQHNKEVRDYFAGRPHDFLEIDLTKSTDEENWDRICAFLGHPVPHGMPFPRANSSGTLEAEAQRHAVGIFATARTWFDRFNRAVLIALQKLFGSPAS